MSFIRPMRRLAIAAVAATLSMSAMASGSFSSGSGVGFQNTYNVGKSVFYKKVVCDDCPVEGSGFDSNKAMELINKLNDEEMFLQEVGGEERQALIYYLTRRYNAG